MLYKLALFLHVTGALLVCAAIAIEWLCIIHLPKANTMERIRESIFTYSKLGKLGDIGAMLILLPGIYMLVAVWHGVPWAIVGLFDLVLIGLIGGTITGRKMKKIAKIIETDNERSAVLEQLLQSNSFWFSLKMRTAILLGVIFLMTVKPGLAGSIITIALSIILGVLPLRVRHYPSFTDTKDILQQTR